MWNRPMFFALAAASLPAATLTPGVPVPIGSDEPAPLGKAAADVAADLTAVFGKPSRVVGERPGAAPVISVALTGSDVRGAIYAVYFTAGRPGDEQGPGIALEVWDRIFEAIPRLKGPARRAQPLVPADPQGPVAQLGKWDTAPKTRPVSALFPEKLFGIWDTVSHAPPSATGCYVEIKAYQGSRRVPL
jgi:hypothetical protein